MLLTLDCCSVMSTSLLPVSCSSSSSSRPLPEQAVRAFGGQGLARLQIGVACMQAPPVPSTALPNSLSGVCGASVAPITGQPGVRGEGG